MSDQSNPTVDPFHRIYGTEGLPANVSKYRTDSLDEMPLKPHCRTSVTIMNYTGLSVATYDTTGIRVVHPAHPTPLGGVVRVQYALHLYGTKLDHASMRSMMHHIPDQHVLDIAAILEYNISPHRSLYLHWDIPVDLLRNNVNGVAIEWLGVVIQLTEYPGRTHLFAPYELASSAIQSPEKFSGIMAYFNKSDIAVDGVWINYNGNTPQLLCTNQKDPNLPEGLTVFMNGEEKRYTLDEMRAGGYYMSYATACAAHASSASEANAIHKATIQEAKDFKDRIQKEEDKRYEREAAKEKQQYERDVKKDERIARLEEMLYNREQTQIDKAHARGFGKVTQNITATLSIIALFTKTFWEGAKTLQQLKGT